MVQIRDLVIGGGDFAISSPQAAPSRGQESGLIGEGFSRALMEKAERDSDAFNISAETDLQLFGVEALNRAEIETEDPEKITEKFFEMFKQKNDELMAKAPNSLAKQKLSQTYERYRGAFGGRAIETQVRQVQSYRLAGMQESADKVASAVAQGTIPYAEGRAMLDKVAIGGERFLDGEQTRKFAENTKKGLARVAWETMPDMDKYNTVAVGAVPPDLGADTVKPYTIQRIQSIREMVSKPSEYDSLFEEMGAKYGVDPKELKLRAVVESGLRATAQAAPTPYGQSGGLMQLEAETAKRLGVTDRNDPRQSVEGAAKLLAQHQKKAGGDQMMVDKLYYAGSEKLMGKNTEQYAANLAAVRGNMQTGTPFDDLDLSDKVRAMDEAQKIGAVVSDAAEIESGRALYMEKGKRDKAADFHYQQWLGQKFAGQEPTSDAVLQSGIEYAATYNAVPSAVQNTFTGMMRSGDANQMILASDALVKIMDSNTAVGNEFPEDVQKSALLVQSLNSQGLKPSEIAERIKSANNVSPAETKAYEEQYNAFAKKNSSAEFIQKQDGFWNSVSWKSFVPFVDSGVSASDIPATMAAALDEETKALMSYYKDPETARKQALQKVRRSWGVTLINNKPAWVENAPEERYGIKNLTPKENSKWMREQILSQYQKDFFQEDVGDGDTLEILIRPNQTDKNYYNVTIVDDNGLLTPMLWKPDASAKQAEIEKEFGVKLQKAKDEWIANKQVNPYETAIMDWKVGPRER